MSNVPLDASAVRAASAGLAKPTTPVVPAIDAMAPTDYQTATFALG